MKFLPEYKKRAYIALELAQKEVTHLIYTHQTLFIQDIDLDWVQSLSKNEAQSEKIDAFVSRFGRLQDHIGEKLIPSFAALLGEFPKSLLDVLAYAERMGWVDNVETFVSTRKLRNLLIHEYMMNTKLFLETLQAANKATFVLITVIDKIVEYAKTIELNE